VAKKVVAKKSPAKKPAAKKAPAKKAAAKKVTPAKKIAPAKKVAPAKKLPPKKPQAAIIKGAHKTALTSSTAKGGATTISVYKPEIEASDVVVVEEKRLVLPPPVRKPKPGKKPNLLSR